MRWLHHDPKNREEAAQRGILMQRIDNWWRAFAAQRPKLEALFAGQGDEWDLPAWMHEHLQSIDDNLMWEFGPGCQGHGLRLVITPEGERWLRPMLRTLLARATKVAGWEFYAFRVPEDEDAARMTVEGRTGICLEDVQVEAQLGEGRKINLRYHISNLDDLIEEEARTAAFVATETLLGEEILDHWIGEIDVTQVPGKGRLLSLDRLKATVDALISSLLDQIPVEPTWRYIEDCEWSGFELHPEEEDDYPDREDIFVAISGRPDVFEGAHGGGVFSSSCLSRSGETFCYLKLDGSQGLGNSRFNDRAEMEEALTAALVQAQLGCCIGGGTGLRYSYIDLALTDVLQGLEVIRGVLIPAGIPKRAWLQFFDADLAHEWVGIHPDAPEPPFAEPQE